MSRNTAGHLFTKMFAEYNRQLKYLEVVRQPCFFEHDKKDCQARLQAPL
jgi:hypothetical protein